MAAKKMTRSLMFGVRVNEVERQGGEELARRAACTPSELLRGLLRREMEACGLFEIPPVTSKGRHKESIHA